jgi:oxygen-dependent protoporphyrinogen oxidase
LCEELGLEGRLQGVTPQKRRAFVLFQGKLHELPEGLTGLVPSRLGPLARCTLLSPAGKARVALDYVLPPQRASGDEPLGGFIRRRLGGEAWERLVEPLMAGIYAADGDRLSLAATFPQLRRAEREHGGLIRGVLAVRRAAGIEPSRSPFLSPVDGLDALVTALHRSLRKGGVTIRTGAEAVSISRNSGEYQLRLSNDEYVAAEAVILAAPAFATAHLVDRIAPELATDLRAIPHAATAIVSLVYRSGQIAHPLDGHGYVVPRVEGGPVLACTWTSRKWAGRAPSGWELIRVFVGRSGREHALAGDDASLMAIAREEVAARLGADGPPGLARIHRWPRAMPQYLIGHPERIARIDAALGALPGVFIAGNAYRGVGIPDCIASGEQAANEAMVFLETLPSGVSNSSPSPASSWTV